MASVGAGFGGLGGVMGGRGGVRARGLFGFGGSALPAHTFNPYAAQMAKGVPGLQGPTAGAPGDWPGNGPPPPAWQPPGGGGGGSSSAEITALGSGGGPVPMDYSEDEALMAAKRGHSIQRRTLWQPPRP